jgi:hypothetical protein
MKCLFTIAFLGAASLLAPTPAGAGERVGDAALGALAGAVVLGPIGAVAGAAVGYTAGPTIARDWGVRPRPRKVRRVKQAEGSSR